MVLAVLLLSLAADLPRDFSPEEFTRCHNLIYKKLPGEHMFAPQGGVVLDGDYPYSKDYVEEMAPGMYEIRSSGEVFYHPDMSSLFVLEFNEGSPDPIEAEGKPMKLSPDDPSIKKVAQRALSLLHGDLEPLLNDTVTTIYNDQQGEPPAPREPTPVEYFEALVSEHLELVRKSGLSSREIKVAMGAYATDPERYREDTVEFRDLLKKSRFKDPEVLEDLLRFQESVNRTYDTSALDVMKIRLQDPDLTEEQLESAQGNLRETTGLYEVSIANYKAGYEQALRASPERRRYLQTLLTQQGPRGENPNVIPDDPEEKTKAYFEEVIQAPFETLNSLKSFLKGLPKVTGRSTKRRIQPKNPLKGLGTCEKYLSKEFRGAFSLPTSGGTKRGQGR